MEDNTLTTVETVFAERKRPSVELIYDNEVDTYEHFRARCVDETPKLFTFKKFTKKKEIGCTEPLYGKKSKCMINIVPQGTKGDTIKIDKSCIKYK